MAKFTSEDWESITGFRSLHLSKAIRALVLVGSMILVTIMSAGGQIVMAQELPANRTGTTDKEDPADWYYFQGQQGYFFVVYLTRTAGDLDPKLWLLNEDREVLVANDDYGGSLNAHIKYQLPYTGEYIVVAGSSGGNNPKSAGEYLLSVEERIITGGGGAGFDIFLSTSLSGEIDGISFRDEDILSTNLNTQRWSMYFDGSDVGLGGGNVDIDGLAVISETFDDWNDDMILLSLDRSYDIPDVGMVDDSDILLFIPTRLGTKTDGTFIMIFDGSDVGLSGNAEDIDAISVTQADDDYWLVLSTKDSFEVDGVYGGGQDLLIFDPADDSGGSDSAGRWKLYFDGSDVGLSSQSENIAGLTINEDLTMGEVDYITTMGHYSVTGQSGGGNNIITCNPASRNQDTSCMFDFVSHWDGSYSGLSAGYIDALHVFHPQ